MLNLYIIFPLRYSLQKSSFSFLIKKMSMISFLAKKNMKSCFLQKNNFNPKRAAGNCQTEAINSVGFRNSCV